jgi:hypothetical protein
MIIFVLNAVILTAMENALTAAKMNSKQAVAVVVIIVDNLKINWQDLPTMTGGYNGSRYSE